MDLATRISNGPLGPVRARSMPGSRSPPSVDPSDTSEAEIAVHWKEEEYYVPPPEFAAQANLTDAAIDRRFALDRFPDCFREYAELLAWDVPWHTTLDTSRAPFYRWFVGGKLNASTNCLDRHLAARGDQPAFVFQAEPEDEPPVRITYRELAVRVNEFASVLRDSCGVSPGDRVTVHLPMVPELPVTMLACARIGAIHSVVFGGFSGVAAGLRAADSGSRVLVTIDGYWRNGKVVDHLANLTAAVDSSRGAGEGIERVLIWRRCPDRSLTSVNRVPGRDVEVRELLERHRGVRVDPVSMPAEAPLFLMYTSGTTGRPKGCQHSTGGYLAYVTATSKLIQDIHPGEVYWCMADIGWITGHSYIVYGPLSLGATSVIYEGVPTFPDPGRPWRIAGQLGVRIFHTSPTAIRQLRRLGPDAPARSGHRFRVMTTVGEPIEPETWRWYYEVVGKGKAVVLDTWWQTETGGFLIATKPALDRMKPGSAGPGLPGIHPVILDESGREIPPGSRRAGNLCIRNPWPGLMQTIWADPERMVREYFAKYNRNPKSTDWRDWPYFAGDGALLDADGYFRILGRIDDVINVAGHRLGTKEIESACLTVPEVAEAAVVPVADALRGKVTEVYVAVRPGTTLPAVDVGRKVVRAIESNIGKIARPRTVHVVPDMPKTRSGKIMRRVLAGISNERETGDLTTLANADVVEEIRRQVRRSRTGGEPPSS